MFFGVEWGYMSYAFPRTKILKFSNIGGYILLWFENHLNAWIENIKKFTATCKGLRFNGHTGYVDEIELVLLPHEERFHWQWESAG